MNLLAAVGNSIYATPIHFKNISRTRSSAQLQISSGILLTTLASLLAFVALSKLNAFTHFASVTLAVLVTVSANTIRSLTLKEERLSSSILQASIGFALTSTFLLFAQPWTNDRPDRLLAIYTIMFAPRVFRLMPSNRSKIRQPPIGQRPKENNAPTASPKALPLLTLALYLATTGLNILTSLYFSRSLSEQSFAAVRIVEISIAPIAVYLSANIAYLTNSRWSQLTTQKTQTESMTRASRQFQKVALAGLLPTLLIGLFLSNQVLPYRNILIVFLLYIPVLQLQTHIPVQMNMLILRTAYKNVFALCVARVVAVSLSALFLILTGLNSYSVAIPICHLAGSLTLLLLLQITRRANGEPLQ